MFTTIVHASIFPWMTFCLQEAHPREDINPKIHPNGHQNTPKTPQDASKDGPVTNPRTEPPEKLTWVVLLEYHKMYKPSLQDVLRRLKTSKRSSNWPPSRPQSVLQTPKLKMCFLEVQIFDGRFFGLSGMNMSASNWLQLFSILTLH